jgi:major membrane immunogen (membrane-anchored lipoprotein)
MRKLLSLLLVLVMMSSLFIGCTKNEDEVEATTAPATTAPAAESTEAPTQNVDGTLADGIYFATEPTFDEASGWKTVVTLEVAGGNIVSADWNGAKNVAGKDKKTTSKDGEYKMVEFGKAQSEWHEQALLVESYLIENQTLEGLNYTDGEGHIDTIAGVSITVNEFEALVTEALNQGPVGTGPYVDGSFYASEADFSDSGWKDNASFTVINGFVVSAYWNGESKDGAKDKKTTSIDGEYKMVEFGKAIAEWHEQVQLIEGFIMDAQDIEMITLVDGAKTDAVTGVTIAVNGFVNLAKEALKLR